MGVGRREDRPAYVQSVVVLSLPGTSKIAIGWQSCPHLRHEQSIRIGMEPAADTKGTIAAVKQEIIGPTADNPAFAV